MELESLDTRLLYGLNHLICAVNLRGQFIFLNDYWQEVLGWSNEEMVGKPFIEFIHPQDREQSSRVVDDIFKNKNKIIDFRNRYLTKSGDYRTLEWVARFVDEQLVAGAAKDITDKVELQARTEESHALLKQAEKMSRVGHWRVDLINHTLFWSDEVYRIHGLKKADYSPTLKSAIDFYHQQDKQKVRDYIQQAIDKGSNFEFSLRIVRPSGDVRNVISRGEIHQNKDNTPQSIFGVFQDITDRELLLSQHNLLSMVANTITTGVVITDPDKKVEWVNEAFTRMSEYALEDVRGKALGPILHGPGTDPQTINTIKQNLSAGKNVDVEILNYCKSGRAYWNHLLISPEYENGKIAHFVGLQHDITERKNAQTELLREEEKYRDVVNNAREVIFQLDKEANWVFLNPFWTQLTGFNVEQVIETPMVDYLSLEHRELVSEYLKKCRHGLFSHFSHDIELYGQTDTIKFVEMRLIPTFSDGHTHSGFQGTLVGKTEFREQQLILARTQRMDAIGELVAGICHDFNNLLGIVSGNSDLLDMSVEDEEIRPFIDHIRKASLHGAELTEKLLKSTRKMSSTPSVIDLTATVNELIPMLQGSIPNNIEVNTAVAPGLSCYSNSSELRDCVINLVINAKNAISGNGEICVKVESQSEFNGERAEVVIKPEYASGYIRLSVSDTGCGISPEISEDIFKPFFTTRKGIGSGLGLSMVAGFVSRFGYGLTLTTKPGKGTCMSIWMPEHSERPELVEENGSTVTGKVPDNIVIIDDEEMLLEAIVIFMEHENVTATAFSDPEMALNYIKVNQNHIDVIITDEIMPGNIQGHDIVNQVKALNKNIKTVLMTGYASSDQLNKIECPIIYKPFSMNQLKKVILEA